MARGIRCHHGLPLFEAIGGITDIFGIEHVRITVVSRLAAKPVLEVDIVVICAAIRQKSRPS